MTADFAVVAAMPQELDAILAAGRAAAEATVETVAGINLHRCGLGGRSVVLAVSGIGIAAAGATAALLSERADAVLMVGMAGGIGENVAVGDVVVARELLQHDFDLTPLAPRWQIPAVGTSRIPTDPHLTAALAGAAEAVVARPRPELAALGIDAPGVREGLIISGDQFVATAHDAARLVRDHADALAVEMEGAAMAQVCARAGVPFALARTVSDRADDDAHVDFRLFTESVAAPYAHDLVVETLKRL